MRGLQWVGGGKLTLHVLFHYLHNCTSLRQIELINHLAKNADVLVFPGFFYTKEAFQRGFSCFRVGRKKMVGQANRIKIAYTT